MRAQRALVLDVNAAGKPSSTCIALRPILLTNFRVDVLVRSKQTASRDLAEVGRTGTDRFNPVLVFLIFSAGLFQEVQMLIDSIKERIGDIPIILINESHEPNDVLRLLSAGASDFISTPLQASDVLPRARRLVKSNAELIKETPRPLPALSQLIGESPSLIERVRQIPNIAKCDANVLIGGETGTGKELYARAIHYGSPRASGPFISVNCGAIPVDLVENELFGHERGAFTSAFARQTGLVEEANHGTLFLDEIDSLPQLAQVKLLRFLQEREYRPLGFSRTRKANVRIIAASNLDLREAVELGKVRADLFYRLNIISISLPPLRKRLEDIPLLAQHFLDKYSREFGKENIELSPPVLARLMANSWPGNVRELEHVIERAVALCEGTVIVESDILLSSMEDCPVESLQEAKAREIGRFEKNYILGLLRLCRGNITKAAHLARKNRRAFWQLIQKHKIDASAFRSSTS
jgi:two-component system, NtrC family, response regulator GlrR